MTAPEITVVIRSTEGQDINPSIDSVVGPSIAQAAVEVIVVSRGSPKISASSLELVRLIHSNARRIEAKEIGVQNALAPRVLFLDSDQTVSPTLLSEIPRRHEDMLLAPERSSSKNLMGRLLDSRRAYVEKKMRAMPSVRLPVVPRIFKRDLLASAFRVIPRSVVQEVTETEDSLIFYECLKLSSSLGWCKSIIYNSDPEVKEFLRKSFTYGYRNEHAMTLGHLPPDYVRIVRDIQVTNMVNTGFPSIAALATQALRGIPYAIGVAAARFGTRDCSR